MADVTSGATGAAFERNPITQDGDKLRAPKHIVSTVQGARSLFERTRQQHLARIQLYAQIEGLIEGNPPYDYEELAQKKLDHIANFNPLDANAVYEKSALLYWNALQQSETLCSITIHDPSPEARHAANIMAKHWTDVVKLWPSFYTAYNTLTGQLVKLGLSPVLWSDERDWRWRTIETSKFYVPDQTQSDVELLTYVFVESYFTVQYLWQVYEDYKKYKASQENDESSKEDYESKSPWKIEELERLLLFFANTYAKSNNMESFMDLMDLQQRIQNLDLTYDTIFSDSIRLVSMLQQEYDEDKDEHYVSHYMFHRYFEAGDFLFCAGNAYDKLQDALLIFTASPGAITLHSNKGVGHKLFSIAQATMQLDCSTVDMAKWSATPILQGPANTTQDMQGVQLIPGVPTYIGSAQFVQNQLGANINQLVSTSTYLSNKLQMNIANSGDDPSVPDADKGSMSIGEVRLRSFREFGIPKNTISHFYSQADVLIRNMFKRMYYSKPGYPGYEYVKEWKRRCERDGVPPEMFDYTAEDLQDPLTGIPQKFTVKASRIAGDGSTLGRILGLQEYSALLGGNIGGPREQREFKREAILSIFGLDAIPTFMQESDEGDERAGGASLAAVENAVMVGGQPVIVSPDNDHRAHFIVHMQKGMEIIQQLQQQQITPVQASPVFEQLVPHTGEHFQLLAIDIFNRAFVEENKKAFEQLSEYARLNKKNAEAMIKAQIRKQQEDQAKTQQVMDDAERKDFTARRDADRKDFQVQATVNRADKANETRGALEAEKTRAKITNDRIETLAEVGIEKIKTEQEMTLEENRANLRKMTGNTPAPADIEG